jgi:hypothetical protein
MKLSELKQKTNTWAILFDLSFTINIVYLRNIDKTNCNILVKDIFYNNVYLKFHSQISSTFAFHLIIQWILWYLLDQIYIDNFEGVLIKNDELSNLNYLLKHHLNHEYTNHFFRLFLKIWTQKSLMKDIYSKILTFWI